MNLDIYRGVIPALMTPCNEDREPEFDALVDKGLEMIELVMSTVIY